MNCHSNYRHGGKGFVPVFEDQQFESSIKIGPKSLSSKTPDAVNNNSLEVNILPNKELSIFLRRILLLFLLLIIVLTTTLSSLLYVRIIQLENESSRLFLLTLQTESKLSDLIEKMETLKENSVDTWNVDCTLDFNATHVDEEEFALNISLEEEELEEEIDEEMKRSKRHVNRRGKNKQRNTGRSKFGNRKRKRQQIICHKCNTVPINKPDRNKQKRFNKSSVHFPLSDMSAIHLNGKLPEVIFNEGGAIGPWIFDASTSPDGFGNFKLEDDGLSLVVLTEGYFFIYAQVYYLSSGGTNSYSVVRKRDEKSSQKNDILATCSSETGNSSMGREESCFTATLRHLQKGDRLHLAQRDMQRTVLFREGQTYFGLVRVSSSLANRYSNPTESSNNTGNVHSGIQLTADDTIHQ